MQNDKDLFHKILGDSMIFFNKDANADQGTYKTRPKAMGHVEDCPCNECTRNRHASDVTNMLRELGAY